MTIDESLFHRETGGVVLIAHGSRNPQANADLFAVADGLRERGYRRVFPCFLELAEPDVPAAGRACVEAGAKTVVLVPYFLSAGRHAAEDLARRRDELAAAYPHIDVRLARPLGPHPLLEELVLLRLREVL